VNFVSKGISVAVIVIAMGGLGASQSVMAVERVVQPFQLMPDAETGPQSGSGYGSYRSYGTDRTDRLRRGRLAENVFVVTVGAAAAAAVAGLALGGLVSAIAAGAAGVYIVLALP
jgi:hypothetical protein